MTMRRMVLVCAQLGLMSACGLVDPAPEATSSDDVREAIGLMESFGEQAQNRYEVALKRVVGSPSALREVVSFYQGLPADARAMRWKAVHLASQLPGAAEFLRDVALSPEQDPRNPGGSGASRGDHASSGTTVQQIKAQAGVGLVKRLKAGDQGASNALDWVLREAEKEVALITAVDLYSAGMLDAERRSILEKVGISASKFRKLSEDEQRQVMQVSPPDVASRRNPNRRPMGAPPALISPTHGLEDSP